LAKKIGVFLKKTNVMIKFSKNSSCLRKNDIFFGENISKIITLVPLATQDVRTMPASAALLLLQNGLRDGVEGVPGDNLSPDPEPLGRPLLDHLLDGVPSPRESLKNEKKKEIENTLDLICIVCVLKGEVKALATKIF
jgi:hypothetical protein